MSTDNHLSEQAVFTGGTPVSVQFLDGSTDTVTVRLLKIREFPDYLRFADQEEQLAAFLCGKDAQWTENLTVESLLDICEKGHDLNFGNACRWGQRRASINEALLPIAQRGQEIVRQFQPSQGQRTM